MSDKNSLGSLPKQHSTDVAVSGAGTLSTERSDQSHSFLVKLVYSFFPWICQHFIWVPARLFFKYFIHLSWSGLENLRGLRGKPVIFAANHSSELDPVVFTSTFPFFSRFIPMFYVSRAKKDYRNSSPLKRIIYGGLFFKLWGAFPTFSGHKDYEKSLTHHIRILEMGMPVMIFPEGGIRRGGEEKEPRGGVAYLAKRTNAVVVPVHIRGLYDMTSKDFYGRKLHCSVAFGEPFINESVGGENLKPQGDYKEAAKTIVAKIYSL